MNKITPQVSQCLETKMANAIRALTMDAVQEANSGHPGAPMGMADVATVLFTQFLKFDASAPGWANRDRFVLSAGHGSMLLYSLLYLTGYPGMDIGQIKAFRQLGAKTAGHPEYGHAAGIETTTGPLGQGIANAVGMALAERMWNARLGDDVIDHHTYVIAGDGCLMEGISQEAISLAGHLKLGRLIVQCLVDMSESMAVMTLDPQLEQMLHNAVQQSHQTKTLTIDPELAENLFRSMREESQKIEDDGKPAILVVSPVVRPWLANLARPRIPDLTVLSYTEIPEDQAVSVVATVTAQVNQQA
jgi:transketolase